MILDCLRTLSPENPTSQDHGGNGGSAGDGELALGDVVIDWNYDLAPKSILQCSLIIRSLQQQGEDPRKREVKHDEEEIPQLCLEAN